MWDPLGEHLRLSKTMTSSCLQCIGCQLLVVDTIRMRKYCSRFVTLCAWFTDLQTCGSQPRNNIDAHKHTQRTQCVLAQSSCRKCNGLACMQLCIVHDFWNSVLNWIELDWIELNCIELNWFAYRNACKTTMVYAIRKWLGQISIPIVAQVCCSVLLVGIPAFGTFACQQSPFVMISMMMLCIHACHACCCLKSAHWS